MWNSRKLVYIKIRSGGTRFTLPLPLMLLFHACDYVEDLMIIIGVFAPEIKHSKPYQKYLTKESIAAIKKIMEMVYQMKYCEPFDLVDIQTEDAIVKISIR